MNTTLLNLSLNVEYNPNGETTDSLKERLYQVVTDAVNNGTLTGDSPATVESWGATITEGHNGTNTVNVIELTEGNFQSIRSFPDTPEGNAVAESIFRKCMKENWDEERGLLTDELISICIEDGHFDEDTYEVLLVHSGV